MSAAVLALPKRRRKTTRAALAVPAEVMRLPEPKPRPPFDPVAIAALVGNPEAFKAATEGLDDRERRIVEFELWMDLRHVGDVLDWDRLVAVAATSAALGGPVGTGRSRWPVGDPA